MLRWPLRTVRNISKLKCRLEKSKLELVISSRSLDQWVMGKQTSACGGASRDRWNAHPLHNVHDCEVHFLIVAGPLDEAEAKDDRAIEDFNAEVKCLLISSQW